MMAYTHLMDSSVLLTSCHEQDTQQASDQTWQAVAFLSHGYMTNPFVVRVGSEV